MLQKGNAILILLMSSQSIKTNALGEVKTVWNEKEMCISELQTML